jgi:hypothetical protein
MNKNLVHPGTPGCMYYCTPVDAMCEIHVTYLYYIGPGTLGCFLVHSNARLLNSVLADTMCLNSRVAKDQDKSSTSGN